MIKCATQPNLQISGASLFTSTSYEDTLNPALSRSTRISHSGYIHGSKQITKTLQFKSILFVGEVKFKSCAQHGWLLEY